jgi:hypothetical protein
MHLARRAAVFVIGTGLLVAGHLWLDHAALPRRAAQVAVESLNGSDAAAERARRFAPFRSAADDAAVVMVAFLAAACFGRPVTQRLVRSWRNHSKGGCRA